MRITDETGKLLTQDIIYDRNIRNNTLKTPKGPSKIQKLTQKIRKKQPQSITPYVERHRNITNS